VQRKWNSKRLEQALTKELEDITEDEEDAIRLEYMRLVPQEEEHDEDSTGFTDAQIEELLAQGIIRKDGE
jgi:hypothetical protein